MANTIKLKNSGTASNVPSSLEYGELGLNYADGKLFYKNSSNNIVQFTGEKGDTGAGGALGYWGSFWSTQDQTAAATGTAYAITFNNSDTANSGVTLSDSSRINFTNAGVYSFIFSIQFANADSKIEDANVWFKKNGNNIPASDTSFSIVERHGSVDGKAVGTVNLVQSIAAGDYIELFWQVTDTDIRLEYRPAEGPAPAIPSVIFTAVQVMYTQLPSATVLDDFQNVTVPSPSSGDFLKYNGTAWVNDAIDLGTDTTGNYMSNVTAGNLITVTHTPGEGSSASIAVANGTSGQIIVANATGVATWVTESGDITVDASGVTSISSNVIVNADINTSAGIALSKLASGSSAQVVLGNATGVPTFTTISGDIAVSNTGVVTIQANSVALGTDTTGDYVASLVAGSGITLSNNSGEGATPTVALTSNSLTVNGTSIALGGSGTVTANASTLTGTSLNSSVTGSSLTSVGTLTSLTVSGNVAVTGAVIDHVITNQQTASYTLALTDDGDLVEMNVGTANNLTVPADNTVNFPIGTSIDILQVGAGQTTIVAASGVTINRATGLKLRAQWSAATIIKRAANTWVAIGDLSA